jgi:hypothetical protein
MAGRLVKLKDMVEKIGLCFVIPQRQRLPGCLRMIKP